MGEELRVVTNLSGDPIWTDSFLNKDGDVHSITAKTLFGKSDVNKDERNRGKRCNFAFIYGGGSGAIQRNIGCSMEDAQRHMNNLRSDVPVLMGYVDHQKAYAKKYKYVLTAFGRRMPIPTIDNQVRAIRKKAERCAINYTIQATAADIIKFAMCYVDKQLRTLGWKDRCRYILTVHDEVVFEVKPEFLMEITRKLDEWMTLPWKLPKAHGRPWVVPLLTEPGIDMSWIAKYNFFEMVDGIKADPKLIEDGKYTGKVKNGYYFANGRIYQEIPDWLKPSIKMLPPPSSDVLPESTDSVSEKSESMPPEAPPILPSASTPPAMLGQGSPPDGAPEAPEKTSEPIRTQDIELDSATLSLDDIQLDLGKSPFDDIQLQKEKPAQIIEHKANMVSNGTAQINNSKKEDAGVLRWTIRSAMNENTMRRLHAVCILAEGDTPLRILNTNGSILVSDDAGIKINPSKFSVYTELFGL